MGWSSLSNGDLLRAAEGRFDLMITTDRNLKYQQNMRGRNIAILVLPTTSWPEIEKHAVEIHNAVSSIKPGDYVEVQW